MFDQDFYLGEAKRELSYVGLGSYTAEVDDRSTMAPDGMREFLVIKNGGEEVIGEMMIRGRSFWGSGFPDRSIEAKHLYEDLVGIRNLIGKIKEEK